MWAVVPPKAAVRRRTQDHLSPVGTLPEKANRGTVDHDHDLASGERVVVEALPALRDPRHQAQQDGRRPIARGASSPSRPLRTQGVKDDLVAPLA